MSRREGGRHDPHVPRLVISKNGAPSGTATGSARRDILGVSRVCRPRDRTARSLHTPQSSAQTYTVCTTKLYLWIAVARIHIAYGTCYIVRPYVARARAMVSESPTATHVV